MSDHLLNPKLDELSTEKLWTLLSILDKLGTLSTDFSCLAISVVHEVMQRARSNT